MALKTAMIEWGQSENPSLRCGQNEGEEWRGYAQD
jgi:hypothetical protein